MSLMVPQSKLNDAHKALLHAWRIEGELWRDEPRRRFFQDTIEPTDQAVRSAASAMERMGESIAKARVECD